MTGMAVKSDALDEWLEEEEEQQVENCAGLWEKCARNSRASRQEILKSQCSCVLVRAQVSWSCLKRQCCNVLVRVQVS
jgi:hypothetical protein